MTTYEINRIYSNKRTTELNETVYNRIFNTDMKNKYFKNPENAEIICRLRLGGKSYYDISQVVNLSPSSVRQCCIRIIRSYNEILNKELIDALNHAVPSNFHHFKSVSGVHDVTIENVAKGICGIPYEILSIKNNRQREIALTEWFYNECKTDF